MEPFLKKCESLRMNVESYILMPPINIVTLMSFGISMFCFRKTYLDQKRKPWNYSKFSIKNDDETSKIKKVWFFYSKTKISGAKAETIAYGLPLTILSIFLWIRFNKFKTNNPGPTMIQHIKAFFGFSNPQKIDYKQLRYILPHCMAILHFMKRIYECKLSVYLII